MFVVGLTGGIASGKSTVSKKLESLGAKIIDADKIARIVVEQGKPAWHDIVSYFGNNILLETGEIDRKALGKIIFSEDKARVFLESATHPRIHALVLTQLAQYKEEGAARMVVLDAPLLIESGMYKLGEQVWVVYCQLETQIERLMARDHLNYGEAFARIKSQMPLDEKLMFANEVINTEGSIDSTIEQVERLWVKYAV